VLEYPADFLIKGDHPRVRKMVKRGRSTLVAALGEEGWRMQAQAMKDEAERWHSKSEIQRQAKLEAEALEVPHDEVLKRLGANSRLSGRRSEHSVQEEVAY
jgi:hypothetical protein